MTFNWFIMLFCDSLFLVSPDWLDMLGLIFNCEMHFLAKDFILYEAINSDARIIFWLKSQINA